MFSRSIGASKLVVRSSVNGFVHRNASMMTLRAQIPVAVHHNTYSASRIARIALPTVRYFSSSDANANNNTNGKVEENANAPPPSEDANKTKEPTPEETIDALRAEVKDLKDKILRCYAEEENVRRIAKRDVEQAREYANAKFATALLDVADYLEYALNSIPESKRAEGDANLKMLYQGVEMTGQQLTKTFNHFGVFRFGKVGDKFDPALHDALFRSPDAEKEEGTISQVLKPGYKLKDRVIRAAQVGSYVKPGNQ
jgi:molecular chaperone GrpE